MKKIESSQNAYVKKYSGLTQKKFRDAEKLFLIEGVKNALDSLANFSCDDIEAVLIAGNKADIFSDICVKFSKKVILTQQSVLNKISDFSSETDIIVVAKQRSHSNIITNKLCLYLDRVRDPGNLGTIIRTAVAADCGLILDNCCDLYNPKVIRSCMSAIISANILFGEKDTLLEYKKTGYTIVGAAMNGKNIFEEKKCFSPKQTIIALGNEASGLSDEILCCCDEVVRIPIEKIESLNVAVAAGIFAFEYKYRLLSLT